MKKLLLTISLLFFAISCVWADAKGTKIMQQVANQSELHKTQKSVVYMTILDAKNRQRDRYFNYTKKIVSKNETKSLIKFYKPTNIKNTALLSSADKIKDKTTQWLYLPAFKSVKRLSTEEKNKSFVGSDFSISDIAGRLVNKDRHRFIKEDSKYYYIESVPKDSQDPYAKLIVVVHKETFVPIKIDFYDRQNKLFKTLSNQKVKKIKGMYLVTKSIMNNRETKGQTTITSSDIRVGISVSNADVGLRGLQQ